MAVMGRIILIVVAVLAANGFKAYKEKMGPLPRPVFDANFYWGPGTPGAQDTSVRPFKINFGAEVIEEIRGKLSDKALSKLRDPLEGTTFNYGMNTKYLKTVLKYWRDDYLPKWVDKHEVFLNKYPQFKTKIQGLDIHFIHVKSAKQEGKKHFPVLLLHGWPGSVVEFYEFIEKLKRENVAFDIVVPSLPGYGFSEAAAKTGLSAVEISVIFRNLMVRLGYNKFVIQGGDWGSVIGSNLATLYPENVIGYHSNMCGVLSSPTAALKMMIASLYPKAFVAEENVDFFFPYLTKMGGMVEESGYFHLQATKPDTIGAALTDNPIGLAAYILEKFAYWTDHSFRNLTDGGLTKYYTLDQLLHNLMFYQLSHSIQTSQRLYAETFSSHGLGHKMDRVQTNVPTGCARFRFDLAHTIDWALQEKFTNLIHSTYHPNGGHFAALQFPDVLAKDFMSFVRKLE